MTDQLFRLPAAFTGTHRVVVEEIDEYDHVNNAVYLQWLDRIAWAHSAELGISLEHCLAIRCGMAVRHTRVDYLEAARLDDLLVLGTWIVASDDRLRCTRRFDIPVARIGRRHQGLDQLARGGRDLFDRSIKGGLVGLRWVRESAELADELKG